MKGIQVISKYLDQWIEEYQVPGTITLFVDDKLVPLGITTFSKDHCDIFLKAELTTSRFAFNGVLWHEFCHAEIWLKEGRTEGHTTPWVKRMLRKPIYIIGSIYAQFICISK